METLNEYDSLGRLVNQTTYNKEQKDNSSILDQEAQILNRNYSYSKVGELLKIEDSRKGITNYHYDKLGRIQETIKTKGSIETKELFSFDPAHNLLNDEYDKPLKNNQIETYQDKRFKYDTYGNLTHKKISNHTEMELSYNAEHRLTKAIVTKQKNSNKPISQTYSYTYDPFGRRVTKTDAFGTTYFTWDGNRLLTETRGESSQSYIYEQFGFTPIASTNQESELNYYHNDHLGTPQEVTNKQGEIVWEAEYETWGNTAKVVYKQKESTIQEDVAFQPLRFQGQYFDAETGLHYNRFRYYDPDIGRFISQDPIGLLGGINLYQYASNPVSWIDPLGLYDDLKDSGMGHHLMPRSIAKKLNIDSLSQKKSIAWYPNNSNDTADLHKSLHRSLIDKGVPFHGSKFEGTTEDFFNKAKNAYDGENTKGFMKIPGTDTKLMEDVTPKEALEELEKLEKEGNIPCPL